jgi:hypothetical protein
MDELLNTPIAERDEQWENKALQLIPNIFFNVLVEEPQKGPDGWPYLLVETTNDTTAEPAQKVISWLSDKGIGLVINPKKDIPDFVFTYGMLWQFYKTGHFLVENKDAHSGQIKFEEGLKVHAGAPSEDFLPTYVRNILKTFFQSQNVKQLKVLVMGQPNGHYDLCFSLESLGNPPPHEHRGVLEAISWFLPSHYSLMIVSEKGLPAFVEL